METKNDRCNTFIFSIPKKNVAIFKKREGVTSLWAISSLNFCEILIFMNGVFFLLWIVSMKSYDLNEETGELLLDTIFVSKSFF